MSKALACLVAAGRHGPLLLCVGVMLGLMLPTLADVMRPIMGIAVFIFTLGAFLKVDREAFQLEARDRKRMLTVLSWTTFGVPVVTYLFVRWTSFSPDVDAGIILTMLAPPVGSAAAIAAMLGLSASLALIATVAATILSPFYLPPLAKLMAGAELDIDVIAMSLRLALIVGGAAVCSWLLRRYASGWIQKNPHAMTGISVVGLIVVAIGAMHGMDRRIWAAPGQAAELLLLAFALNVFFQLVSAGLFFRLGTCRSLTVGLASGNRNVTLVWAAATPFLASHPGIELFLAMSVFPIFMLPLLMRQALRLHEIPSLIRFGARPLAPSGAAVEGSD